MLSDHQIAALVEAGRSAIVRGQPASALLPLKQALTWDPDNGLAHALLADALTSLNRLEAALAEANAAIGVDTEMSYAHVVLAHVLFAKRDVAGARRHFETARELDPSDASALRGLAALARFEDRDDEALRLFEAALELEPDDPLTHTQLADLHLDRGRLDQADASVTRALELEPEQIEGLVVKGHVYLRRGQLEEARDHAIWALRIDATRRDAVGLLAGVKARQSLTLGLWYRANVQLYRMGPRQFVLLLGLFLVTTVLRLVLEDLDLHLAATVVRYAWLAVCVYSWVGPPAFQRMIDKELETVRLDPKY